MKKGEMLAKAESCLGFYESQEDKKILTGDFEMALAWYERLAGALYVLQRMELISEEAATARKDAAFQRYISVRFPVREEAKAP